MAIDFPDSPSVSQEFTSGTTTWVWDGTAWNLKTTSLASNDTLPVGSIMWFAIASTPTGWLPCDGATYTNSAYPSLVSVIGTTFGGSAGVNFKVPTISATTGAYYIRYTTAIGATSTLSLITAPVGSMLQWPVASSYPTAWLRCDGSAISRTSYADLYALIGTTYGIGDGATTFNLPNISTSGSSSPVYIIKGSNSGGIEPSTVAHAASHVRGGSDIIDADRAQIDYVPTNYTRDSSIAQAGTITDLTAHLAGINNSFALNTVTGETTLSTSTSSTTYVATALTATITKNYSDSKILVQAFPTLAAYKNAAGESYCKARLIETGSSRQKDFLNVVRSYNAGAANVGMSKVPLVWLDTQTGTGSRTYRLDVCMNGAGTTVEFNAWANGLCLSNIILSEVF